MNKHREELVKQLQSLREQQKVLNEKIDAIDYDERFSDASKYLGRFYKEKPRNISEWHVCYCI